MLIHFPTPYPEETFYSVLCRYYISTGIREMATVDRELFGGKNGSSICTLYPNRTIASVMAELPDGLFDVKGLILNHTSFLYYTRIYDKGTKTAMLKDLAEGCGEMPAHLWYTYPRMKYSLRYCPLCVKDDTRVFGEPYYHVVHQIPLSCVCTRHRCRLKQIRLRNPQKQLVKGYYPLCLMHVENEPDMDIGESEYLISQHIQEYCIMPLSVGATEGHNNLMQTLFNAGFGTISRKDGIVVERKKLYSALCEFYGAELVAQVFGEKITGDMVNRIKTWECQLPDRYIMIQAMLGLSSKTVFDNEPLRDEMYERLISVPGQGSFTTLKEVSEHLGLREYEVGSLFRQYGLDPIWQKAAKRKEPTAKAGQFVCHVKQLELEQIRQCAKQLGYSGAGPFALDCIRYVMEQRGRSEDASNKVYLLGGQQEEPEK